MVQNSITAILMMNILLLKMMIASDVQTVMPYWRISSVMLPGKMIGNVQNVVPISIIITAAILIL